MSWLVMNAWIASRLAFFTTPRLRASSVANRIVQRARPSGDGPQSIATKCGSSWGLIARSAPGRGFSHSARSKPSVAYRCLVRKAVLRPVPTAAAAASALLPSSISCKRRARLSTRTDSRPRLIKTSSFFRSRVFSLTLYTAGLPRFSNLPKRRNAERRDGCPWAMPSLLSAFPKMTEG